MISAKIIADSINTHGQRLTTFVLVFPRIVLAEFNTHRMISRNSASSRAIPFEKMVERCKTDPFIPIRWMKEHPGMQGTEYFPKEWTADLTERWLTARDAAVRQAELLSNVGVTKQFCNRLLEPFMWHTVICTASDYENFFSLRAHEAAEIHIQDLAHKMLEEYNSHAPTQLQPGEWHIPFGDQINEQRVVEVTHNCVTENALTDYKIKIATARCARISYNTFEGKDDYEADIKLHDRLASSGHWSPFEHCAKAMTDDEFQYYLGNTSFTKESDSRSIISRERGWCGNFRGFIQYRKLFNNENRKDGRVRETPNQSTTDSEHQQAVGTV